MASGYELDKKITYFGSERRELHDIFPDSARDVLDVGCGSGMFGKELKKRGIDRVVGVEIDERAASLAEENLDKALRADVEKSSFDFKKEEFDVIVFADVLEHLVDPWGTMETFKGFLKKEGFFLISIPNIRYHRVLSELLFKGQFQYEEHGILDIGHLRFFTFKMIKQYLDQIGLEIVRTNRNFAGPIARYLNKLSLNVLADLFTRQYIILAQYKR